MFDALVSAYLTPVPDADLAEIQPRTLAATVAAHLEVGQRRRPGDHLIRILPPGAVAEVTDGSTLALVVTQDRPFLVDTLTMELTRQGWSLRWLYHPQVHVRRDPAGRLQEVSGAGSLAESWIALEIYPPLGTAASALVDALAAGFESSLEAVRSAVEGWAPMLARARAAASELAGSGADADPVDLLDWLIADHFVFLGYAEYAVDGPELRLVPTSELGILQGTAAATLPLPDTSEPLLMGRDPRRSPVHRPAYLERVRVRRVDAAGRLLGEHHFVGLLAAAAYTEAVAGIPVLAAKARSLLEVSGFEPQSYGWNAVRQVIATYPRDELFEAGVEELAPIVSAVASLRERRQTRVFLRTDRLGSFVTVLVFLPRDRYNTDTRLRIQRILLAELGGVELEFTPAVSESVLTRLCFVVRLAPGAVPAPNLERLAGLLRTATRSWDDDFVELVSALPSEQRGVEFSEAYTADYPPAVAVADLALANALTGPDDLKLALTEPEEATDPSDLRLKLITRQTMSLTTAMPHLSVFGVEVVDERPYSWDLRGTRVLVYDFGLRLPAGVAATGWDAAGRERFMDAFAASLRGSCEADDLNHLVVTAGLGWQQVSCLRGISRYLQQAGVPFSQPYLAAALRANPTVAAGLVAAFET
ncbi:MAG: NAD-glutamate dehydrogenase, partial [Propionicimonas sp.]